MRRRKGGEEGEAEEDAVVVGGGVGGTLSVKAGRRRGGGGFQQVCGSCSSSGSARLGHGTARQPSGIRCQRGSALLKEEKPVRGEFYFCFCFFFFILCAFATRREEEEQEEEECVLRAGMMSPNRGFILLLLNGTACLVREEFYFFGVFFGWGCRVTAHTLCTL